jgi:hypothetical protein
MTMWAHHEWNLWAGAQPAQRPPGRCEEVLARVRHPSFSPDLLDDLLRDLPRRQLQRLWRESGRLLDRARLDDSARLNLVVMREQLLDRLDARAKGPTPGA